MSKLICHFCVKIVFSYLESTLLDYGIVIRSFYCVPASKTNPARRNGSTTCSKEVLEVVAVVQVGVDGASPFPS